MPEISRFLGVVIALYWRDHGVAHFHAKYGEMRASISIEALKLLEGSLPPRVMALVLEWAFLHRDELMENWQLALEGKPLRPIEPLQ